MSSWTQRHVEPQADSLLEQSAQGVAKMWIKLDCIVSKLEAMGNSPAGLPFKVAVAVHLQGRHLAEFIEHQPKGLFGLMLDGPAPSFSCLLAACISVSSGVFENTAIQKCIRDCVKSFESNCRAGQITHHTLH